MEYPLFALAGGNDDRNDIDPVIEVFAEFPFFDLLRQVLVRGRNEPHIDFDRF